MPTVAVLQVSRSLSLSLQCSVMLTLLVKFQAQFRGAVYTPSTAKTFKKKKNKKIKRGGREREKDRDSCLHVAVSGEAETDSQRWVVVLSCDG